MNESPPSNLPFPISLQRARQKADRAAFLERSAWYCLTARNPIPFEDAQRWEQYREAAHDAQAAYEKELEAWRSRDA